MYYRLLDFPSPNFFLCKLAVLVIINTAASVLTVLKMRLTELVSQNSFWFKCAVLAMIFQENLFLERSYSFYCFSYYGQIQWIPPYIDIVYHMHHPENSNKLFVKKVGLRLRLFNRN